MEKLKTLLLLFLVFIGFSALLFLCQYCLQEALPLSYRIHFLIFFVTLISIASILIIYGLGRKDILGFVFLGFVVFKLFAIGYIALFHTDFKENIVAYFTIYWIYLALEVFLLLRLMKNTTKIIQKN